TRRNYEPIRVMMDRIESLRLRMDGGSSVKRDELTLIDYALESLIERTSEYEKRQRESMLLGRRQLFIDIIHGERLGTLEERLLELKPLPAEIRFTRYAVVVVEIGQYSEFQQSYSI